MFFSEIETPAAPSLCFNLSCAYQSFIGKETSWYLPPCPTRSRYLTMMFCSPSITSTNLVMIGNISPLKKTFSTSFSMTTKPLCVRLYGNGGCGVVASPDLLSPLLSLSSPPCSATVSAPEVVFSLVSSVGVELAGYYSVPISKLY